MAKSPFCIAILPKITPCFENGKSALLDELKTEIAFGSTEFHVVRTVENIALPRYMYYLLRSEYFMTLGETNITGSAGQKRVPTAFLSNFPFAFPSIDYQFIVIEYSVYLRTTSLEIVDKLQTQIDKYQAFKKSLISEVVTGKKDVSDWVASEA